MMKSGKVLTVLRDYAMMTLACFIFAFSWEGFMIPNSMTAGGLMGLGAVLQYATDGFISASVFYIVINVFLIVVSVVAMGIGFGFRTIYCIAISEVALQLVALVPAMHAAPGSFFYLPDPVLVPVVAGVLEAVGVGLIIRYGGSTGGTDIIAIMVNKYWPVRLSRVFMLSDLAVIFSQVFLPDRTFSDMAYGLEMMVTFSLMIDTIIGGEKTSYQLMVFSEKFNVIADHIISELDRGVTVLKSQGWYTKQDKNVLLIIIGRNQLPMLTKTVKEIDPKAFMSVSKTSNVYGEGFEEIKTGISKKKNK